jgi:hypothetical protein
MSMWDYDRWGRMLSLREAMNWLLEESFVAGAGRGGVGALQMSLQSAIRAQAGASRSACDDERAEVAPTTDEASAESSRTQQTTDEASAESSRTQQTTATRQTGGAAGPSDETADLPGDASGAS